MNKHTPSLLLCLALLGCGPTKPTAPIAPLISTASPKVGKTYWIEANTYSSLLSMYICDQPKRWCGESARTSVDKPYGPFKILGTTSTDYNEPLYQIETPDHSIKYILQNLEENFETENPDVRAVRTAARAKTKAAEAKAECARRGRPVIGMTADEVRATCWGKPRQINRTEFSGLNHEQWVYGTGFYVYLENGVATSVQMSR